jgi:hypothetical protein
MNALSMRRILTLLLLVGILPRLAYANQAFQVLVLDALDGKPQSGVMVDYFCEGQVFDAAREVRTNLQGIAEVPFSCGSGTRIGLSVNSVTTPTDKYECGWLRAVTLEEIMLSGVISKPNSDGFWCPARVSRKLKPVPGRVILFIKRESWLQSHWPTGPDG